MANRQKCTQQGTQELKEEILEEKQFSLPDPEMKIRRQETREGEGFGNFVVQTEGKRNRIFSPNPKIS